MAKGDPPLVVLRKATRKLTEVQRNLAEAAQGPDGVYTDDLHSACVRLKEDIIQRYEALGGKWEA